eukprot:1609929-Prymnesium_polylepis.1
MAAAHRAVSRPVPLARVPCLQACARAPRPKDSDELDAPRDVGTVPKQRPRHRRRGQVLLVPPLLSGCDREGPSCELAH